MTAALKRARELAEDIARDVLDHLETMYPEIWKQFYHSARLSLRNTIIAKSESALEAWAQEARPTENQICIGEVEAQIVEAEWWNEQGLDMENYISPEDVEKRLNFLRNVLRDLQALEQRTEVKR
jgi:hypothetical protein